MREPARYEAHRKQDSAGYGWLTVEGEEIRDFYSGSPNCGPPMTGKLQNNVVFTGGLLAEF